MIKIEILEKFFQFSFFSNTKLLFVFFPKKKNHESSEKYFSNDIFFFLSITDKKDEGEWSIARSNKKSTKMSRAISGNLASVVPGNDQRSLSRKISTSVGREIILVLSPGLSLASQRGLGGLGFGKCHVPRVRFQ